MWAVPVLAAPALSQAAEARQEALALPVCHWPEMLALAVAAEGEVVVMVAARFRPCPLARAASLF